DANERVPVACPDGRADVDPPLGRLAVGSAQEDGGEIRGVERRRRHGDAAAACRTAVAGDRAPGAARPPALDRVEEVTGLAIGIVEVACLASDDPRAEEQLAVEPGDVQTRERTIERDGDDAGDRVGQPWDRRQSRRVVVAAEVRRGDLSLRSAITAAEGAL